MTLPELPSGPRRWTSVSSTAYSQFSSVAVDSSGDIYAAGYIGGRGLFGFGNQVTATVAYLDGSNILIVKYDSSGAVKWAQTG